VKRTDSQLEITVNAPRPLDDIAAALARQHAWRINYEDPRWGHADLVDATAPSWLAQHPNSSRVFAVRGAAFRAVIPVDGYFPDDPIQVLPPLVQAYNESANPGKFELRSKGNGWFDIVAGATTDGPQTPLLDTIMNFDATTADNTYVTMQRFAKELAAASAQEVVCDGTANPTDNIPFQTFIEQHSSHQPAREILRQMLPQIGSNYSWRLLYDHDTRKFWLQWR